MSTMINNEDCDRKCTETNRKEFDPIVMTAFQKENENYVCFSSTSMAFLSNTEKFILIDRDELHNLFNSSLRKDVPGYFEHKVDELMNDKESLCIFNS